jgi:hypothetical protein
MGWTTEDSRFDSWKEQGIFCSSQGPNQLIVPTWTSVQWVPESLSREVRRLGREADHLPSSSAEVKNVGAIASLPHSSLWGGV